jgi:hypothetical protein
MSNDLKWMLSSDQQFPYQDDKMIELWFKVMKWFKPDVVDYLGDTDDQACYSKYTDGKPTEFLKAYKNDDVTNDLELMLKDMKIEASGAREFYVRTRKMLPKAQLFSALGNHDIRIFDYLDKKIPEYAKHVTPEALWSLDSLGYDYIYYDSLPKKRFGDIHVHHGLSIAAGGAVRKDMEDMQVSLIRGHSHRIASHMVTYELRNNGKGETLRGYEIGHMCDEKGPGMKYTQHHDWQKGFAIAHIENGKYPHVQMIHVSPNYTCVVDGKMFAL